MNKTELTNLLDEYSKLHPYNSYGIAEFLIENNITRLYTFKL